MNQASEMDNKPVDVFSRGSLKLTFDALRPINPMLALQVRNIIHGEPLPKSEREEGNEHADYFKVALDSFQIRAVVEGLMECGESPANKGLAIIAKSLQLDWVNLAHQMLDDLPEGQKPS
jgi:hypothetical protein